MGIEPTIIAFSDVEDLLGAPASVSAGAVAAMRALADSEVPLVFCSTRTRAEVECLQRRMRVRHPFICENGAAVFIPDGYFAKPPLRARAIAGYDVVEYGGPYGTVLASLARTARRLSIDVVGFNDMSVSEIARECGVSLLEGHLSKLREYGEPFRIVSGKRGSRQRLFRSLAGQGFGCVTGGKYDHVGAATDEGVGIAYLTGLYRQAFGSLATVGFGDPKRDTSLLRSVSVPIPFESEGGSSPGHQIMKLPPAGPRLQGRIANWLDALKRLCPTFAERPRESAAPDADWT